MKIARLAGAGLALIVVFAFLECPAAVPPLVNYQGQIKVSGVPFTGNGQFKFAVIEHPTGATLWSNDGTSVNGAQPNTAVILPVKDGLFTALLGDVSVAGMQPVPPAIFATHPDTLLRCWFNDGVNGWNQLADRLVASSPYAMQSEIPNGSITGAHLDLGTVQPTNMAANNPPQIGKFLRYESNDRFSWADISVLNNLWVNSANGIYYNGGLVGIGTANPQAHLHVVNPVESATQLIESGGGVNAWAKTIFRNGDGEWHIGTSRQFNGNQFYIDRPDHPGIEFFIQPDGAVGIGAYALGAKLHLFEAGGSVSQRIETGGDINAWARLEFRNGNGQWNVGTSRGFHTDGFYFQRDEAAEHAFEIQPNGDVYAGRDIHYPGWLSKLDVGEDFTATVRAADFQLGHPSRRGAPGRALVDFNDSLHLNFNSDWANTVIGGANVSVCTLTIRGGCDLAEPFPMKEETIEKGSVVVIDEEHPGLLKLSRRAYDTRVAGIVSGANGVNPGISLKQEGRLDQGENVALTGRVYVRADARAGAIKPGDLLTTSDTPGHAMKVSDHARSQGAILGKAMSGLEEGTGLVLVLVTLQ